MRMFWQNTPATPHTGCTQSNAPPAPNAHRFDDIVIDCGAPLCFSIESEDILKVVSSFPKGSGGGSDGLLPQHLKDLLGPTAGDGGGSLLRSLVGLSTLILEGRIPLPIRPLFFGANLTALTKKCGGIRPIAVGCTLRRLASKCACQHALKSIPEKLAPHQLGFGVGGRVRGSSSYWSSVPQPSAR